MQATQRRVRLPLSCEPCRSRKLKCNREKPCQNCIARSQQDECHFRGHQDTSTSTRRRKDDFAAMRQRIEELEGLVKRLVSERSPGSTASGDPRKATNSSKSTNPHTQTPQDVQTSNATGKILLDGSSSVFHGGNDWHLVLKEIGEIKNSLGQNEDPQPGNDFDHVPSSTIDGTSLLSADLAPFERSEIIDTLPPPTEIERLISWFFNRNNFPINVPPILHEPTLRRELRDHWNDPARANLIWIGLIFSILSITMLAYHQHGEPLDYEGLSESLFHLYRTRTAQCLLRGDIARCLPYTVETLRLNAIVELNRNEDNRRAVYITTGVLVRAAINMGYHRDPSHSADFTAFQAEYRRRVWSSVVSMDDMASFNVDFPRMIPSSFSDTTEPRNIYDWELSEKTDILPESRPLSEATPVTFQIVKGRFLATLSRITDFNSSLHIGSYDVVVDIDRALHHELESIPPHMKVILSGGDANIPHPSTDYLWYPNLQLVSYYHLGMCTLHKRFMVRVREDVRFKLSRERCVSSAVAFLSFQRNMDTSLYHLASARQTFALAPMLLFLEVELRKKDVDNDILPDNDSLLKILEHAVAKWEEATHLCNETRKIYGILKTMLVGYQKASGKYFEPPPVMPLDQTFQTAFPGMHFDPIHGGMLFDLEESNTRFDWSSWDAFIEEAQTDDTLY